MSRKFAIVLPDLRPGGAEVVMLHLARWFLQQGYGVDFVLRRKRGALLAQLPPEINVVELKAARVRNAALPLRRYMKQGRPDAVLAAMWPLTSVSLLAAAGLRLKPRIVVSDHNVLSRSRAVKGRIGRLFLRASLRWLYPRAAGVVAVSSGVADDLAAAGRIGRNHISVIHNPAARGQLPTMPKAGPAARWAAEGGKKIIAVGTLKEVKDFPTLLGAFRIVRETVKAKLLILGDGPLMAELTATAEALGVAKHVLLAGHVEDPYPYYLGSDLFVLSSRTEGFANVIVEAMECGLPVVSTDCPSGPAEILAGGRYGRLVPVGDAKEMAEAIVTALTQAKEPDRQRERAGEFNIERAGRAYLELLDPGAPLQKAQPVPSKQSGSPTNWPGRA